jgi:O-antigen/teichoic acid export membrane protein
MPLEFYEKLYSKATTLKYMSGIQRLIINTGLQFGTALLNAIFTFFFTYFAARNLDTAVFGQFSVVQIFVTPFITLTDFGLSNVVIRDVAQNNRALSIIFSNTVVLKAIIGIFVFFLVIIIAFSAGYKFETFKLIIIFGISIVPYSITNACISIFNGKEKMIYSTIPVILGNILGYAGSLIFIIMGFSIEAVYIILLICSFIAAFASLAIVFFKFTRFKITIDLDLWKNYMTSAIPFGVVIIINLIGVSVGPIILTRVKGEAAAGYFNIAYKIINIFLLFISAYNAAVYPVLSRLGSTSKEKLSLSLGLSLKIMMIVGSVVIAMITTLSDKIIQLLFPKYLMAIPALQILAWFSFFSLLATATLNVLFAEGREREVVQIMFSSTVTSIVVTLCLLSTFGVLGVCIGLASLTAVQFLLSYRKLKKRHPLNMRELLFHSVSLALPVAFLGIILHSLPLVFIIFAIVVLLIIEFRTLNIFTKDELIILFGVPVLAHFIPKPE